MCPLVRRVRVKSGSRRVNARVHIDPWPSSADRALGMLNRSLSTGSLLQVIINVDVAFLLFS
jgi:hypothetical protein